MFLTTYRPRLRDKALPGLQIPAEVEALSNFLHHTVVHHVVHCGENDTTRQAERVLGREVVGSAPKGRWDDAEKVTNTGSRPCGGWSRGPHPGAPEALGGFCES